MGRQRPRNQRCILSATKPAISIKLVPTVGHVFYMTDIDFVNVYMACPSWWGFLGVVFEWAGGGSSYQVNPSASVRSPVTHPVELLNYNMNWIVLSFGKG